MAAKSRIVKWQKVRDITTNKKYNGEASAYWNHLNKSNNNNKHSDFQNEQFEYPTSNPDVLAEPEEPTENLTRRIIQKNWREIKFSKREQEVLVLLSEGITPEDVAKRLSITRRSVRVMIERIQKKGLKWFVAKRANNGTYKAEEEL